MVREPPVDEPKTARQWSQIHNVPYSAILAAVKDGRLDAMRYSPKGQIFIQSEDMVQFIEDAKHRARDDA